MLPRHPLIGDTARIAADPYATLQPRGMCWKGYLQDMVSSSFQDRSFAADYYAVRMDAPPAGVEVRHFRGSHADADAPSLCVHVASRSGHEWCGIFTDNEEWDGALTGIAHLPNPSALMVIVEGSIFLVDAESGQQVSVDNVQQPLTDILAAPRHNLLLVSSPFDVHAFGRNGLVWVTPRVAIEDLQLREIRGDRVYGLADVDDRPNNAEFWVDLKTGKTNGGFRELATPRWPFAGPRKRGWWPRNPAR